MKDYLLNHAVMTAYRRLIEARRYPSVVLALEVAPGDVDVNVHPAKMEVRFRDPRAIYALIAETLGAVIGAGLAPRVEGPPGTPLQEQAGYAARVEEALKRYRVPSGSGKLFFSTPFVANREAPATPPQPPREARTDEQTPAERHVAAERRLFSELAYVGQVAGTYLVFADAEGMLLVDQHAAHERILFEKLKRQAAETTGGALGQRLLIPEVVSLPPAIVPS